MNNYDDTEKESIKKMLASEPYTHDGVTEYGGLPPISPVPQTTGKNRMSKKAFQTLICDFKEANHLK
ncbi:hypothetical protein LOSG293_460090 [Secundilactobacillus oryzae JCM 18671]|uniref:Uncharacterized protein n=2 Tax=Secundilactobacillus oryzae TaxID=1202668 RepID=A0A081BKV3_9LACO|nr:hypothetical protein [Secundilactobacillus oryzae]GAK48671.1 hypothetical protein LOSG293_460090 [Secundilactobacillus oryzae JCM 18671]